MTPASVVGALLVRYESGPPRPRRFEVTGGIGYRGQLVEIEAVGGIDLPLGLPVAWAPGG